MRFVHYIVAGAIIVAMAVWLIVLARDPDRHPIADETEWVTSGYRTFALVRDLAGSDEWEPAYADLRAWGHQNPPVGKLIIGAAVAMVRDGTDPVRYLTTFPFDYTANLEAGNFPPVSYLAAARTAMALCGFACLVLIYVAAVLLTKMRWAPLIAPISLFASQTFVMHATRVFTDVPQLALILGAVVAMMAFARSKREWQFALALVFAGLACATKFSAAPVIPAAMLFVATLEESWRRRALRIFALAAIPLAVFVAVNPYLYPAPIERTRGVMHQWSAYVAAQQQDPVLRWSAIRSRVDAVEKVASRAIVAPQLGEWATVACAITGLVALALLRRRRSKDRYVLAMIATAMILDGPQALVPLLVVLGGIRLVNGARGRDGPSVYVVIVVAMFVLFTVVWIPFDWPRYYLPALIWMPLVHAAGVAQLAALTARDEKAADIARAG